MTRILLILIKLPCYAAAVVIVAAVAALALLGVTGLCPQLDEGGISCAAPLIEHIAELSMLVVLLSAFTVLPLLLAGAGLILLVRDVIRLRRKSAAEN